MIIVDQLDAGLQMQRRGRQGGELRSGGGGQREIAHIVYQRARTCARRVAAAEEARQRQRIDDAAEGAVVRVEDAIGLDRDVAGAPDDGGDRIDGHIVIGAADQRRAQPDRAATGRIGGIGHIDQTALKIQDAAARRADQNVAAALG